MTSVPISVKAIVSSRDAVLFLRNPRGEWELPGGRPRDGESLEGALLREVEEECRVVASSMEYLGSASAEILPDRRVLLVFFHCSIDSGEIFVSDEHSSSAWISLAGPRPADVPVYYWEACRQASAAWGSRRCAEGGRKKEGDGPAAYPLLTGTADEKRLAITADVYDGASLDFLSRFAPLEGSILEVGCGHGQLARAMARVRPNCRVMGLDASVDQIQVADQFNDLGNLRFVAGDLLDPALASSVGHGFDLIYSRFTLLHVPDRRQALASLSSLLSPAGILVFEEPSLSSLFVVPDLPAFRAANEAIRAYGTSVGVDYDVIEDVWSAIDREEFAVVEAMFRQPTIWSNAHKELVALSFEQFAPKLVDTGLLTPEQVQSAAASLRTDFVRSDYISGGLRTLQVAIRRHSDPTLHQR